MCHENAAKLFDRLMENPANYMTPTRFAEVAKERMPESCEVLVRVRTYTA